jgi:hypothetical protein
MEIIVTFNMLKIMSDEHNFNRAKLFFAPLTPNGETEFSATIEINIPDNIHDIGEIKKYALQRSKDFLSQCVNADFVSQPHLQ